METPSVALIGSGPRSLTMLDRLGAHARHVGFARIRVKLIDPYPAGAGRVWDPDQHPALLNNTAADRTTVFCDNTITSSAPIIPGPTLYEWSQSRQVERVPEQLRHAAHTLQPWSQPQRALQGHYFRWALGEIRSRHREILDIEEIGATATVLASSGLGWSVTLDTRGPLLADAVILGVGFLDDELGDHEWELSDTAQRSNRLRYIAPGIADPIAYQGISVNEPLLVRGLGATFFDLLGVLASASSRDRESAHPQWGALPESFELTVGSPNGLPKRAQPNGPGPEIARESLTPDWFAAAEHRHSGKKSLPFLSEVFPLVEQECSRAFERYASAAPANIPGITTFNWDDFTLTPHPAERFPARVSRYISQERFSISHPNTSPWLAVRQVILQLRPRLAALMRKRAFLESDDLLAHLFFDAAGRTTNGPPAQRLALLLDLAENEKLRFIGPNMSVTSTKEAFLAYSAETGMTASARQFVDARQRFGSAHRTSSPLVRGLLHSGIAGATALPTGHSMLNVEQETFSLRSATGESHPTLRVAGHLARAVQRGVLQGPEPRNADPFLQETDTLAADLIEKLRRIA